MSIQRVKLVVASCQDDSQLTIVQFHLGTNPLDIYITVPVMKEENWITNMEIFTESDIQQNLLDIINVAERHFGWPKEWWISPGQADTTWLINDRNSLVNALSISACDTFEQAIQLVPEEYRTGFPDVHRESNGYMVIHYTGTGWTQPVAWKTPNSSKKLFVPISTIQGSSPFTYECEVISMGSAESFSISGDVSIETGTDLNMQLARLVLPFNVYRESINQPYLRMLIATSDNLPDKFCWETIHGLRTPGRCTTSRTGSDFAVQQWFECFTCGLTGGAGCCVNCAVSCHAHHRLVAKGYGLFFCDCSEQCLLNPVGSLSEAN